MTFELMDLPYSDDALDPVVSAKTVSYHYGKHHRGYVNKLNTLIEQHSIKEDTLEKIVLNHEGAVFNNAAQILNHDYYWRSMAPGGRAPQDSLRERIDSTFGSLEQFGEKFVTAGAGHFGSGWVWLTADSDGRLEIETTHDAGNPIKNGKRPLLTCDVWEHAYYLDFQNARPDYLKNWLKLINWEYAQSQLGS